MLWGLVRVNEPLMGVMEKTKKLKLGATEVEQCSK